MVIVINTNCWDHQNKMQRQRSVKIGVSLPSPLPPLWGPPLNPVRTVSSPRGPCRAWPSNALWCILSWNHAFGDTKSTIIHYLWIDSMLINKSPMAIRLVTGILAKSWGVLPLQWHPLVKSWVSGYQHTTGSPPMIKWMQKLEWC